MIGQTKRLGEQLVSDGVITSDQLEEALSSQGSSGTHLGQVLVELGMLSAPVLVNALASRLNVKGAVLRHGLIDPKIVNLVDKDEATRLQALPMFRVRDELTVAMAEPQSLPSVDRLAALTGCRINPILALEANIVEYQSKYLGSEVEVDAFLASIEDSDVRISDMEEPDEGPLTNLDNMVDGSPIVNLVSLIILTAMRDGASDIHIEPSRRSTRVRYRLDGRLRSLMSPPASMHSAIVSRIKVIGRMDISEKRLPQEGRVHIVADGREIDLRISTMPTILGEKIVIRILDRSNLSFELRDLGLEGRALARLNKILRQPHGLVLVAGPTGSGKTTTLYSALDLLRSEELNIVTVEDPVEYQLEGINQIQANAQVGMTFGRALRSILRQDPDIIMVGEIRDEDTARVAVQAAMTGHLVMSTIHTNDCPGVVTRLIDMGIEPYLVATALIGAVSQRLARSICPNCKTQYYPTADVLERAGMPQDSDGLFSKGEGCQACHNSGFKGRCGIFEVMQIDDTLERMIHTRPDEKQVREHLAKTEFLSLREAGLRQVELGRSSIEEVLRVTADELRGEVEEDD
jgi:type IV pilus assembly protein PilB